MGTQWALEKPPWNDRVGGLEWARPWAWCWRAAEQKAGHPGVGMGWGEGSGVGEG